MHNPFSLAGKTILVTGASSGIGRSIAIEASRMGARLVITARHAARLDETFRALEGDIHQQVVADLTQDSQIEALAGALPPLDGVVYAAGMIQPLPIRLIEREDIREALEVNLMAPILLSRELIVRKKLNPGVSFVILSSLITHTGQVGHALYAASKGGLHAAANVLGKELLGIGARVNTLSAAMVETPLIEYLSSEEKQADQANYPLGYGRPEDVAYAAVYLLSDAARWVCGSELILDGGLLLSR